jgi:hypothetical protein
VVLRLIPAILGAFGGDLLLVRGALTLDLRIGRRTRRLGPLTERIAAPPETVFDVIAAPYLGKTPRAMKDKLDRPLRATPSRLVPRPADQPATGTVAPFRR